MFSLFAELLSNTEAREARPLNSWQRPASVNPNASAIQRAAASTSWYDSIGTTGGSVAAMMTPVLA